MSASTYSPLFKRRRVTRTDDGASAMGAGAAVAEADGEADAIIGLDQLPNDTLAAVQLLRRQFPSLALPQPFAPLVLVHQLYSIVTNKTTVDKAIEDARQAKSLLKFRLPLDTPEYFVVLWTDYTRLVAHAQTSFATKNNGRGDLYDRFLSLMGRVETDIAISRAKLAEYASVTEEEISTLIKAGFLLLRDGQSLWFTIPNLGSYVVQLTSGRTDTLAILKRRKFHEILEKMLVRKRLRRSQLGWDYHLSDLQGIKCIESKSTGEGNLIRLAGIALAPSNSTSLVSASVSASVI